MTLAPRDTSDPRAQATRASFGYEFTVLDPTEPPARRQREDVVTFFRATGLDPEIYRRLTNAEKRRDLTPEDIGYEPDGRWLQGKLVLDAGCGAGRFSRLAASYGASVVALDSSQAVERARSVTQGQMVSVVQGDVLSPPLRARCFDLVFSIGVLHHTVDTRRGLRALAELVRPGGLLAVWVYPPEYWAGAIRGTITRAIRAPLIRLPLPLQATFVDRVLYPIGRLQMVLARRPWTKLLAAPLFALNVPRYPDAAIMRTTIFDYWTAPIIRTHRAEELYDWFSEIGFTAIEILPMPTAVRAWRPAES